MHSVSVVIPVFRGEHTLGELYRQLIPAMEAITPEFEIIFVEDCGGDGSWEMIAELAEANPRVHGIALHRDKSPPRAAYGGRFRLYRGQADQARDQSDDRLQHPTAANCQRHWLYLFAVRRVDHGVGHAELPAARQCGAGICLPGLDH